MTNSHKIVIKIWQSYSPVCGTLTCENAAICERSLNVKKILNVLKSTLYVQTLF